MQTSRKPIILVVDDSPSIRAQVKAILEREGYAVRVAGTEIGMLNSIDEYGELSDVILMDLNLNQAHGFDLISKLNQFEQYKHIPVIVLTEQVDKGNVSIARAMGVKDYIAKPVNADLLKERIKNILSRSGNKCGGI